MFIAIRMYSYVEGMRNIWQFVHMVDASDRFGNTPATQLFHEYSYREQNNQAMHSTRLVGTTLQLCYEEFKEPFEDVVVHPFLEYGVGPEPLS